MPTSELHETAAVPGTAGDPYRDLLLAQRASCAAQFDQLRAAAADLVDEAAGMEAGDDDELGDADGTNVERDRLLVLAETARRSLARVDTALARLDAGAYGRCEGCGEPIPSARLAALPEATHCVGCKSGGLQLRRGAG